MHLEYLSFEQILAIGNCSGFLLTAGLYYLVEKLTK